jgi:hypothetical protein
MKIVKTLGFGTKSYSFLTYLGTPIGHMENNFDCEVTLDFVSKTGTQMTQAEKICDRRICSIENKPFYFLHMKYGKYWFHLHFFCKFSHFRIFSELFSDLENSKYPLRKS